MKWLKKIKKKSSYENWTGLNKICGTTKKFETVQKIKTKNRFPRRTHFVWSLTVVNKWFSRQSYWCMWTIDFLLDSFVRYNSATTMSFGTWIRTARFLSGLFSGRLLQFHVFTSIFKLFMFTDVHPNPFSRFFMWENPWCSALSCQTFPY